MAQRGFGGTMGQDWGGRRPLNPEGCPKVTADQVRSRAKRLGIEVKREGKGMWWFKKESQWYTLGMTNFLAIRFLKVVHKQRKKEKRK